MPNVSVVEVRDLTIRYGEVTAVSHLDLDVAAGEVVGLLGGNGAGKSSTLRAVAGVNPPSTGTLIVAGHDLADDRQVDAARQAVGYCPDVGGLLRQATVREHIGLALAFRRKTQQWPRALDLLERFDLSGSLDRITTGFSHGMCRRLSVLLAVLTAEQVLVLDEPFDGVDPLGVEAALAMIADARRAGLGILVSTHLLPVLTGTCDRIVVMAAGALVDAGESATFAGVEGLQRYTATLQQAAM